MVIVTTDIQLFQILKQKLGEKEAEALVGFVDVRIREGNETNIKILSTKEDIAATRLEIATAKAELIKWMFIFWVGQVAVTFGFILLFLNK
jgi:hypothetical protein